MLNFAGIKNTRIIILSDSYIENNNLIVVEIPYILKSLTAEDLVTNYIWKNNSFITKNNAIEAKNIKLAIITNFKMQCGIATYADNLFGEIVKGVNNFKLFIENNDAPIGDLYKLGSLSLSNDNIEQCWVRGGSLENLANKIKEYDPDIILINHEWGIFPNARYWLALMSQLFHYRTIVIMHSVFAHKDKTICEAAMQEIVVHLDGAQNLLKNIKEIPGKVYVIPHGSEVCSDPTKLWNFYKSDKTFIQFGYGFKYKGFEQGIKTTAILKKKYNDVFFTILFSDSLFSKLEHDRYHNELLLLINDLGLNDNVAIIRGYQSDTTLNAYLRTNQATIFPYVSSSGHEVFGVSGAARYAMTTGIPVITSSIPHFSDLPTLKGNTPEEYADLLDNIFSNNLQKQAQITRQIEYLDTIAWNKIADQYLKLFSS